MFQFQNYEHFTNTCKKLMRESNIDFSYENREKILEAATFAYESFQKLTIDEPIASRIHSSMDILTYHIKHASYEQELIYYLPTITESIKEYNTLVKLCFPVERIEMYYENAIKFSIPNFTTEMISVLKTLRNAKFGLFKLYDKHKELIYIGHSSANKDLCTSMLTNIRQQLMTGCFISYAQTNSIVDTNIYKIYYIGLFQPMLNKEFIENDLPTIKIEELDFSKLIQILKK